MSNHSKTDQARLESLRAIKQALIAQQESQRHKKKDPSDKPRTSLFRPTVRPPMAMVCVLDDGGKDGEWVRLRQDAIFFARNAAIDSNVAHVLIEHDAMISNPHAKIVREAGKSGHRWYLMDLGSTNGTFIRIVDAPLVKGSEFLLGGTRFRFDDGIDSANEGPTGTFGYKQPIPALLRILNDHVIERIPLTPSPLSPKGKGEEGSSEHWIGRDSERCTLTVGDDRRISSVHARIYRDKQGAWHIENGKSRNGTWLRIEKQRIARTAQFQLGEQRFLFKVLTSSHSKRKSK